MQNPVQIHFVLFRFRKSWNRSDLARLALISRARVTQIMDLLMLAPDIQEALLFLPPVYRGRDPIAERDVRSLLSQVCWEQQRCGWVRIASKRP